MNDIIKENKSKFIIILIFLVLIIIFLIIKFSVKSNKYIYTLESNKNSSLPYININDENILLINDQLKYDYDVITKLNDENYMKYKYYKSNDILSLIIEKGIKNDSDSILEVEYNIYNISLKANTIYTNDEIIALYKLDKNQIYNIIYNELKKQYDAEVYEGYLITQQCDFNCFLDIKNFTSFDDNIKLAIKNNKVYAYLNIQNGSLFYTLDDYPKTNKIYEVN